jgi:hypothetical protein
MMTNILVPVVALVAWTLIVWIWMYALRLPAMSSAKLDPQAAKHPGSLSILPSGARQVADNYNHLHEQPTIFYALAIATHLLNAVDTLSVQLAWGYVALRVLHSLIQNTINIVGLRFLVFSAGTIVLMVMTVRTILAAHGAG